MDGWNDSYHYLIDAFPKGVQVIDRQGIVVDANRAWLIYFGVTLGDVKGRHIRDVMQDMVFANPAAMGQRSAPTEYNAPAALETLRTGLPYSTTFNQDRMIAVARPVYHPRGQFDYVVTTITDRVGSAPLPATPPPAAPPEAEDQPPPRGRIVGQSEALLALRRTIAQVAPTGANILICGETGTGKEVVADELHRRGGRADRPMIRVNCAALPENLIESELFGYERGAFTGALSSGKAGLIETAQGGTLFLDEVNALPLPQQGKLLRVLESRAVQRVGSLKEKPVDFRLLAATNADLEQMVAEGTFRADLYYRLNVIQLRIPPLRERRDDILPIMQYYLDLFGQQYKRALSLSPAAGQTLLGYHWPGNVRELRNLAEYLAITVDQSEVLPDHITARYRQRGAPKTAAGQAGADPTPIVFTPDFSLKDHLDQCERRVVEEAYRQFGSSRKVAEALKIDQSSAVRKKGKYQL